MEVFVDYETKLTLLGLQQYYKNCKLFDLVDVLEFNQVVIFVKSVECCMALARLLLEQNFPAIAIHRGMAQEEQLSCYQAVQGLPVVDRGTDIERVNTVFNYDIPEDSDTYLRHVARAGCFGTKDLAITFVSDENDANILSDVQDRFEMNVAELPEEINISTYIEQSRCINDSFTTKNSDVCRFYCVKYKTVRVIQQVVQADRKELICYSDFKQLSLTVGLNKVEMHQV
ncbi:hypothetical protein EI555_002760, partial [Monodon monoceros]